MKALLARAAALLLLSLPCSAEIHVRVVPEGFQEPEGLQEGELRGLVEAALQQEPLCSRLQGTRWRVLGATTDDSLPEKERGAVPGGGLAACAGNRADRLET